MTEEKINLYPGPYHWYLGKFYDDKHREAALLTRQFLNKNQVVLDVGCGDGRMEELLAPFVKKIIGIDNQERPIEFAKLLVSHKNVEFIKNNDVFPVKDESVDAVVCFDVIEHIPVNEVKSFLDEIKRVVKKGGNIIITTPNRKELRGRFFGHRNDPKHYQEFSIKEIRSLFDEAGLKVSFSTGIYVPLPIPFIEHFANIYPFYWIFKGLIKLGEVFPSLAETIFLVGVKE